MEAVRCLRTRCSDTLSSGLFRRWHSLAVIGVQVLDCSDGGMELLPGHGRCCAELVDEVCPFFSVGLLSPLHLCVGVKPAGPCQEKWNVKPRPWAIGDGRHLCGRGLSTARLVEQCGLAVVKMGWIPNAANPTKFLGPVVYGKLSWPVDAAVWPGAFILDGRVCSGDMVVTS